MKLKKHFKQITLKNKSQMKTKNVLVAAVILISSVLSVSGVFAQNESSRTATVNLKITLNPIQTITVNPANTDVNIEYKTIEDYSKGKSTPQEDHLVVFSTGGFQVKVNTDGDLKNGDKSIASTDVLVSAAYGSKKNEAAEFTVATGLSQNGHTLLTSTKGGRDLKFNVTYDNTAAGKNDAYILAEKAHGKNVTVYTTKVTYTIAAN